MYTYRLIEDKGEIMKDEFKVIYAPTNLINKWELYVKGEISYVDTFGDCLSRLTTRKIGAYFKEDTAYQQKAYLEDRQQFEEK